jgi:ATP-dependent Clp protease ATP-binding subunit ClpB
VTLAQVRGSNRVVDQDPEGKYEALSRYGRDLTIAARDGKLDPVIGRDDEIRSATAILGCELSAGIWLERFKHGSAS